MSTLTPDSVMTSTAKAILATIVMAVACTITTPATLVGLQETPEPKAPVIAKHSDEAKNAIQVFQLPDGVKASVFAAEPDVANPVAIDVDHLGRVWVCESFRQENGIEDNRNHPEWLNDDLAAQTVADRLAYIKKHLGESAIEYTTHDDRIRLLVDTDNNGAADQSTVFADQFNAIEQGTGAGVLFHNGNVYYTCIPDLLLLNDQDDDGRADVRIVLQTGYGVRFAFRGHDLHGLIVGPDGRLYFSIGDRGYHVSDSISDPASGAVFRCDLDGSNLEVVHKGLRNPQELAFDNYGNLFTGDNNSDSGDKARMVYVVEGGDSGWRMNYQYLPDRGPFNRRGIWHGTGDYTSAMYVFPPIDNFADGPSGFAFYPGTGFSEHMNDRFLLCDFRGQTSGSGIKTFRLKPQGAFFKIADEENTFWNLLATDCCFGPGGKLYVSDWVHGWYGIGKGRIYSFADKNADHERIKSTRELLNVDLAQFDAGQLCNKLGHPDRRVRQRIQFELARRKAFDTLTGFASGQIQTAGNQQFGRIHCLWALDQIARNPNSKPEYPEQFRRLLAGLLDDQDVEIQAQALKLVAGYYTNEETIPDALIAQIVDRLEHGDDRVKYFATIAIGKLANADAIKKTNQLASSADRALVHAAIMAFVYGTERNGEQILLAAIKHADPNVRKIAAVACRKLFERGNKNSMILKELLNDSNGDVVNHAVEAIHDLPVRPLYSDLAKLNTYESSDDAVVRRVLNANFVVGGSDCLQRIAAMVQDPRLSLARRRDAVRMLSMWNDPPSLDQVLGEWRPIRNEGRTGSPAATITSLLGEFREFPDAVGNELIVAAKTLNAKSASKQLVEIYRNGNPQQRFRAVEALIAMAGDELPALVEMAINDSDPNVRMAAVEHLAKTDIDKAEPIIAKAIEEGTTRERQNAIRIVAASNSEKAKQAMRSAGLYLETVNIDSQLDVVLAIEQGNDMLLKTEFKKFMEQQLEADPQFRNKLALHGGDAELGKKIFFERTDVSCLRCHKIQGSGGDVGPNLSEIGKTRDRNHLLESLLQPNKTISEGFETVVVLDADGKTHVGVTKASTDEVLSIMTADAIMVNIPQDEIDDIRRGESAMPNDVTRHLSLREIRDLIEYLATRETPDPSLNTGGHGK